MEKITFKASPGQKVECILSGIQGVIDGVILKKNGSKQLSVQPRTTNGHDKPDAWLLDEDSLKVVEESAKPFEVNFKHSPGFEALDSVTGIKGIIINAICWVNGCKHYSIQPKAKKGQNKKPNFFTCDESDIIILKEKKKKEQKSKPPGGPSERSALFKTY
jgi:hypothetical protein